MAFNLKVICLETKKKLLKNTGKHHHRYQYNIHQNSQYQYQKDKTVATIDPCIKISFTG